MVGRGRLYNKQDTYPRASSFKAQPSQVAVYFQQGKVVTVFLVLFQLVTHNTHTHRGTAFMHVSMYARIKQNHTSVFSQVIVTQVQPLQVAVDFQRSADRASSCFTCVLCVLASCTQPRLVSPNMHNKTHIHALRQPQSHEHTNACDDRDLHAQKHRYT
jgi:hypothetical protein